MGTILRNYFGFGPVVQEEMSFKICLIWSSGGPHVRWSGTIYAILKEGIMGNIHVKLYEIWTSGSGGDVVERHFLSRALVASLFSGLEQFVHFWKKAS